MSANHLLRTRRLRTNHPGTSQSAIGAPQKQLTPGACRTTATGAYLGCTSPFYPKEGAPGVHPLASLANREAGLSADRLAELSFGFSTSLCRAWIASVSTLPSLLAIRPQRTP
jgi:hypothetical protein